MSIIAIDPGPTQSAVVDYDPHRKIVLESRIEDNETVLKWLRQPPVFKPSTLVIENMEIPTVCGREIFDTCIWIGRFVEAWGPGWELLRRSKIKQHLCPGIRAKDPHIRQALIDKFGGEKACEGPVKLSAAQQQGLSALSARDASAFHSKVGLGTFVSLEKRGFVIRRENCHVPILVIWGLTDAGRDALAGKCGPLYGMATHKWSALAAAVTWAETHNLEG